MSSALCELKNATDLIILNLFTNGQGVTTKLRHHIIRAKNSLSAKNLRIQIWKSLAQKCKKQRFY